MRKLLALLLLLAWPAWAGTLLPNGRQQFLDANGNPLASGTVTFYVPSTSTLKNTWQDANQTILNTNPVVLDSGGYALIYGSGQYRQLVKDSLGNVIWDQATESGFEGTVENINYYASSVGGAANAITVSTITPSDYSLTAGKTLRFISPLSNTGSTTLNPIALGVTTIKRVTITAGVANLAGGELVSGGVYDVLYDGSQYILLNPSVTDNPGDFKFYGGAAPPAGYATCWGQPISRTTFAALFTAIGVTWGPGDGVTTFNVPDIRNRALFGIDSASGSTLRITAAGSGINGLTLGAGGGNQLLQEHLHTAATVVTDPGHNHTQNAHNHAITDPAHSHSVTGNFLTNAGAANVQGGANLAASTSATTNSSTTGVTVNNATATNIANTTGITATTTTANAGLGTSQNMPPAAIAQCIIRL